MERGIRDDLLLLVTRGRGDGDEEKSLLLSSVVDDSLGDTSIGSDDDISLLPVGHTSFNKVSGAPGGGGLDLSGLPQLRGVVCKSRASSTLSLPFNREFNKPEMWKKKIVDLHFM